MANTRDFLLELGAEEMPPKAIKHLADSLAAHLQKRLHAAELTFDGIKTYAAPRRLAVLVDHLLTKQPDKSVEIRGPAVTVAFDADGAPTVAGKKFAESCGVDFSKLERLETAKGAWLVCKNKKIGQNAAELLPDIVSKAIKDMSIHRAMRWGNGEYSFVRPVHWLVMIFGSQVIDAKIFGIDSSNKTYGHRFHYDRTIALSHPQEYETMLAQKGFVIADFAKRREKIKDSVLSAVAQRDAAYQAVIDDNLLNEVTGMVEWPTILLGEFPVHFLELPKEILITCLEHHQRCFPVVDAAQKLLPLFVVVSNLESLDPAQVVKGNERVVRARLADAEFFYRSDLRFTLDSFLEKLKTVVFQANLGSMYDKTLRIEKLTTHLAQSLNVNIDHVDRAAHLCKCDLVCTTVGEFPELQGIMGGYYAQQQYEPEPIVTAIKEHYLPKFAKDNLPSTSEGQVLAIADRIDTLIGAFGINKMPTGEKDPLGLRRAAIGVLRIILEKSLPVDLKVLCEQAYSTYQVALENSAAVQQALDFILERLRVLMEEQGTNPNIVNAVLARNPTKPIDIHKRIEAINYFLTLPEAETLCAAHKRVNNILNKADYVADKGFDCRLVVEAVEQQLADAIAEKKSAIRPLYEAGQYREALQLLAEIKSVVDDFFKIVMVMDADPNLRNNRLALLADLRELFIWVADLSLLGSRHD